MEITKQCMILIFCALLSTCITTCLASNPAHGLLRPVDRTLNDAGEYYVFSTSNSIDENDTGLYACKINQQTNTCEGELIDLWSTWNHRWDTSGLLGLALSSLVEAQNSSLFFEYNMILQNLDNAIADIVSYNTQHTIVMPVLRVESICPSAICPNQVNRYYYDKTFVAAFDIIDNDMYIVWATRLVETHLVSHKSYYQLRVSKIRTDLPQCITREQNDPQELKTNYSWSLCTKDIGEIFSFECEAMYCSVPGDNNPDDTFVYSPTAGFKVIDNHAYVTIKRTSSSSHLANATTLYQVYSLPINGSTSSTMVYEYESSIRGENEYIYSTNLIKTNTGLDDEVCFGMQDSVHCGNVSDGQVELSPVLTADVVKRSCPVGSAGRLLSGYYTRSDSIAFGCESGFFVYDVEGNETSEGYDRNFYPRIITTTTSQLTHSPTSMPTTLTYQPTPSSSNDRNQVTISTILLCISIILTLHT